MPDLAPSPTLRKLVASLGMLGSDHDGEVLNAARAAEMLRRQLGKNWDELLTSPEQLVGGPAVYPFRRRSDPPVPYDWRSFVHWCQGKPAKLTDWEKDFLANVSWAPSISGKQWEVIRRIADKALS